MTPIILHTIHGTSMLVMAENIVKITAASYGSALKDVQGNVTEVRESPFEVQMIIRAEKGS